MILPIALAAILAFGLRGRAQSAAVRPGDPLGAWAASIARIAQPVAQRARLPLSLAVAQAALESSWGRRAPGGNLYGIKGKGPAGSVRVPTSEELSPGTRLRTVAAFRAYPGAAESVADWARFLSSDRYAPAKAMSPGGALVWIWASGYATAGRYPEAIAAVSRSVARRTGRRDLAIVLSRQQLAIARALSRVPARSRPRIVRAMAARGDYPA